MWMMYLGENPCRPDPGHPCHEASALTTTTHIFIFSLSYIFPIHIKPLPGGNYTNHYTTWFKLHRCFGLSCIHFLSVYLVSNLYPSKEGYLAIHFYYRINDWKKKNHVLSCFIVIFDSEEKGNNPVVFTKADKIATGKVRREKLSVATLNIRSFLYHRAEIPNFLYTIAPFQEDVI